MWIGAAGFSCVLLCACADPASGSHDWPAKEPGSAAPAPSSAPTVAQAATAPSADPTVVASAVPSGTSAAAPAVTGKVGSVASNAATAEPLPTSAPSSTAVASATASAAPSEPPAPALTVTSAPVQEAAFSVWMSSAKSYKVGQTGYVEAVVVPRGEFHCNESYPYKVKLGAAPAGIAYSETLVRGASISPTRASIRVPFTATSAGEAKVSGKFYFSVCKADQCVMDSRDVAATVKVE